VRDNGAGYEWGFFTDADDHLARRMAAVDAFDGDRRANPHDYVAALLERGRARASADGFAIEFREADAEALPFAEGSFDVVLSTFGVMFTPDQERAAAELRRVCRPGGRIGLALAYTTFLLPVFIWMMKGYLDAVPPEIEDAARVDGTSRIGAMLRVVLPLALPGLVATAVFIAIGAWNEYLIALMLTTSTGSRTWPVGLQLMVGEFQLPWGSLAAGGIMVLALLLARR
jgi:SAM-dependent methyltransferase